MRTVIQLLVFFAAIAATAPACAELYKWVDERGVTNYSNEPPPATATANKLTRVGNTISVYTPDESFMQAVQVWRERAIQRMSQPEAEPQAVARASVPPQSGYELCLLSGRVGCDDLYRSHSFSYLPAVAVYPLRGMQAARFLNPHPSASRSVRTHASRASPVR